MNIGNSRRPVFNQNGQVIGIAVEKVNKVSISESTGVAPEDINFALEGSEIRSFANLGLFPKQAEVSVPMNAENIYASKRGTVIINETN